MTAASSAAGTHGGPGAIPVENAWHLLLYAWDLAEFRGNFPSAVEASPNLLGLLARILAASTNQLLNRQLGRAHSTHRETIRGIRGRIDIATSLKRLTFHRGAAHCIFPQLSVDTLKNRILRATLHQLAADPRLTHPTASEEARLRHELRSLVRALEDVPLVPISAADFSRLQLGRNDRDYAIPLAICSFLRRLQMPTERQGDHAMFALLRDEITFHQLFERFVRNFYRHRLKDHHVTAETLDWHDEMHCPYLPQMRTDITIVEEAPPHRRLIIDTKFYGQTLAISHYGGPKFHSANLYQLYAYLRTQEHLSEAHRQAEGLLLYPTTQAEIRESIQVQGHRIRVATLNLCAPWPSIETELFRLSTC